MTSGGDPGPAAGAREVPTWSALASRVALLLGLYVVLAWWLLGVGRLPEASYAQTSILLETLANLVRPHAHVPTYVLRLAALAAFAALALRWGRRLIAPWSAVEAHRPVRALVGVVTLVLAWAFASYDYNFFFDRAHLADRIVLVSLACLVLWRPVFVIPFALLAIAMIGQLTHPIGPFSAAESQMLVRILVLFSAALVAHALTGRTRSNELMLLVISLVAASYLRCGVGKVLLDASAHGPLNWMTHGHVHFLLFATHGNGWLGGVGADTLSAAGRWLSRLDPLVVGGTLALELGAILVLWHRRVLLAFLSGWIVFHLGILAMSGICFWKWIAVDATLLAIFASGAGLRALPIFSRRHFALSLPLVAGGLVWFQPANLAWYDSPVSYTYRFTGVGESGARYTLPPSYFAPYDYQFTMGGFHYLTGHDTLGITWGAIMNRADADALLEARTPADVEALERRRGRMRFDAERSDRLLTFIRRFVAAANARGGARRVWPLPPAPPQFVTADGAGAYDGREPIAHVIIHQVTGFFDGESYREFRTREVAAVDIPGTTVQAKRSMTRRAIAPAGTSTPSPRSARR